MDVLRLAVLFLCAWANGMVTSCEAHHRARRSIGKMMTYMRYDPVRLIRMTYAWDMTKEIMKSWRDVLPTVLLLPLTSNIKDTYGITKYISPEAVPIKHVQNFGPDLTFPELELQEQYMNYIMKGKKPLKYKTKSKQKLKYPSSLSNLLIDGETINFPQKLKVLLPGKTKNATLEDTKTNDNDKPFDPETDTIDTEDERFVNKDVPSKIEIGQQSNNPLHAIPESVDDDEYLTLPDLTEGKGPEGDDDTGELILPRPALLSATNMGSGSSGVQEATNDLDIAQNVEVVKPLKLKPEDTPMTTGHQAKLVGHWGHMKSVKLPSGQHFVFPNHLKVTQIDPHKLKPVMLHKKPVFLKTGSAHSLILSKPFISDQQLLVPKPSPVHPKPIVIVEGGQKMILTKPLETKPVVLKSGQHLILSKPIDLKPVPLIANPMNFHHVQHVVFSKPQKIQPVDVNDAGQHSVVAKLPNAVQKLKLPKPWVIKPHVPGKTVLQALANRPKPEIIDFGQQLSLEKSKVPYRIPTYPSKQLSEIPDTIAILPTKTKYKKTRIKQQRPQESVDTKYITKPRKPEITIPPLEYFKASESTSSLRPTQNSVKVPASYRLNETLPYSYNVGSSFNMDTQGWVPSSVLPPDDEEREFQRLLEETRSLRLPWPKDYKLEMFTHEEAIPKSRTPSMDEETVTADTNAGNDVHWTADVASDVNNPVDSDITYQIEKSKAGIWTQYKKRPVGKKQVKEGLTTFKIRGSQGVEKLAQPLRTSPKKSNGLATAVKIIDERPQLEKEGDRGKRIVVFTVKK